MYVKLHNVAGDNFYIIKSTHGLAQYRQQSLVQLNRDYLSAPPGKLSGQRADARPDFQHAYVIAAARGLGNILRNPAFDQKVLPHAFRKMKAVAAKQSLDVPDVTKVHILHSKFVN